MSEYNPFHLGHLYHLKKTRELSEEGTVIVCALSGDFVQRGEPSVISKFARAEAALRCGADIVVELPSVWALQSAEGYASAAVEVLSAMGVSALSFGVEAEDPAELTEIAGVLCSGSFEHALSEALKERNGISYPAVREEVLQSFIGPKAASIRTPNNILAVEYMKAAVKNGTGIRFLPVRRTGAGHDSFSSGDIRSASEIRSMLLSGEDISAFVPESSDRIIRRETECGRGPVSLKAIEQALVSRLRRMRAEDFLETKDCDAELSERIENAVAGNYALADIFASAKTRKYALSRVRRVCVCAALGITAQMQERKLPYIRILAAGQAGQTFLRQLKKERPEVHLATRPADILKMGDACGNAIRMDSAIHDVYVLGYSAPDEMICGMDFRHSPLML